jgi:hypothetical protein
VAAFNKSLMDDRGMTLDQVRLLARQSSPAQGVGPSAVMLALRDTGVEQSQRAPGCVVVDVERSVICTQPESSSPVFKYEVMVPTDMLKFVRNTNQELPLAQRAEDFRESLEKFRKQLEKLRAQAEQVRTAKPENEELYTEIIYSYRQGISIYSDSIGSYKKAIGTNFSKLTGM